MTWLWAYKKKGNREKRRTHRFVFIVKYFCENDGANLRGLVFGEK
jgi:hypothetical protein